MMAVLVVSTVATWGMVGVIWMVQLVHYPLHARLAAGHDDEVMRSLISSNWIRTAAWSLRGVVLAAALVTPA